MYIEKNTAQLNAGFRTCLVHKSLLLLHVRPIDPSSGPLRFHLLYVVKLSRLQIVGRVNRLQSFAVTREIFAGVSVQSAFADPQSVLNRVGQFRDLFVLAACFDLQRLDLGRLRGPLDHLEPLLQLLQFGVDLRGLAGVLDRVPDFAGQHVQRGPQLPHLQLVHPAFGEGRLLPPELDRDEVARHAQSSVLEIPGHGHAHVELVAVFGQPHELGRLHLGLAVFGHAQKGLNDEVSLAGAEPVAQEAGHGALRRRDLQVEEHGLADEAGRGLEQVGQPLLQGHVAFLGPDVVVGAVGGAQRGQ